MSDKNNSSIDCSCIGNSNFFFKKKAIRLFVLFQSIAKTRDLSSQYLGHNNSSFDSLLPPPPATPQSMGEEDAASSFYYDQYLPPLYSPTGELGLASPHPRGECAQTLARLRGELRGAREQIRYI